MNEGRLAFTTDAPPAIRACDVAFICVGTPQKGTGKANLDYVVAAAETIADSIEKFTVIVDKSTVPVGTAERLTRVISERTDPALMTGQQYRRISAPTTASAGIVSSTPVTEPGPARGPRNPPRVQPRCR